MPDSGRKTRMTILKSTGHRTGSQGSTGVMWSYRRAPDTRHSGQTVVGSSDPWRCRKTESYSNPGDTKLTLCTVGVYCHDVYFDLLSTQFSADRILSTYTIALMLQCCVCLSSSSVCTECIVAKRCILEQKLLLTA